MEKLSTIQKRNNLNRLYVEDRAERNVLGTYEK